MENSHRKISLLSLIALRNYIPRVTCPNDASNQSRAIYSREICRVLETINPIGGVSLKKLLAFNNRQRDHELIRQNAAYEKTKTDFGKFLCWQIQLRHLGYIKYEETWRTLIPWRNYSHAWQITVWTLAPVWWENINEFNGYMSADIICSKMRRFPIKSSIWLLNAYWLCGNF